MKILKIKIENFKCIQSLEWEFSPKNIITGMNGVGKTSVYDAWLWLLFGKNAEGRTDFSFRPYDADNKAIEGLVVLVEATLEIDGDVIVLRKEHHENIVKDKLTGFSAKCWIDEVPKKVGEYQNEVSHLIDEDTCRLLSDLYHFTKKLDWKARRKILIDIAGSVGEPEGFEWLLKEAEGRSLDDYNRVLADRKKNLKREREGMAARIDELLRNRNVESFDASTATEEKAELERKIEQIDNDIDALIQAGQQREEKLDAISRLKEKRTELVLSLAEPFAESVRAIEEARAELVVSLGKASKHHAGLVLQAERLNVSLDNCRKSLAEVKAKDFEDAKCSTCG